MRLDIDNWISFDELVEGMSLISKIGAYKYKIGEKKMSYTGIVKHVDEDITWEEITRRVGNILDGGKYPFGIDAITIEKTGFMWGDKRKAYKKGVRVAWGGDEVKSFLHDAVRLGALCYALNQAFKGAHCTVTSSDGLFPVIYGRTDVEKTESE